MELAFTLLCTLMFAVSCWNEEPYYMAFWGVFLIVEAIREVSR